MNPKDLQITFEIPTIAELVYVFEDETVWKVSLNSELIYSGSSLPDLNFPAWVDEDLEKLLNDFHNVFRKFALRSPHDS
jgi:hypothetical protein